MQLSFHLCAAGLWGGLLPAAEDWSSAGHRTRAAGNRKRTQNFTLPQQDPGSFLTGISSETLNSCLYPFFNFLTVLTNGVCVCVCIYVYFRAVVLQLSSRGCCQWILITTYFACRLQVVCRFLCKENTKPLTEKQFIPAVRKFIMTQLLSGFLSNCFLYINRHGCVFTPAS